MWTASGAEGRHWLRKSCATAPRSSSSTIITSTITSTVAKSAQSRKSATAARLERPFQLCARPSTVLACTGSAASDAPQIGGAPHEWRVYNGRMPLVGFEQLAKATKGTPLQQQLLLHTYTLLEGPGQVWCYDFLPLAPTSPATALLLLTARKVPGEVRVKQLSTGKVTLSSSIRFAGHCRMADPLAAAHKFNMNYDTELHLFYNNCKHHTDGLTQLLLLLDKGK